MSHGIMTNDRGYVMRDQETGYGTWHNIDSYRVIDTPVTKEQVREVLDYEIVKRELYADRGAGPVQTGVFEAYREDTGDVLIPSCSETYDILNNVRLFDHIDNTILKDAPDIDIESVGTLKNGQVSFLNLKLGQFTVKGDDSDTMNRLMYYNPLGIGSYKTCAHQVRIVCNNTLRAAEAQGVANGTLQKVRHTKNAEIKLEAAIETITGIKAGFEQQEATLNMLATQQFDRKKDLVSFVESRWFYTKPSDKRVNKVVNRIEEVYENTRDEYGSRIQGSKYQLLQAVTNTVDHAGRSDSGYRQWDGLTGIRAGLKTKFFEHLTN